jgi:hypothetical protein
MLLAGGLDSEIAATCSQRFRSRATLGSLNTDLAGMVYHVLTVLYESRYFAIMTAAKTRSCHGFLFDQAPPRDEAKKFGSLGG